MTHPRRTPCAAASVRPRRGTSRASTRALPQRTPRSTPRCLPRLSPPSRRVKSSPPVRVFSFQPAPALADADCGACSCSSQRETAEAKQSPHIIESIEIFSLYRCRARKIKPWFTGNPPLAPLGRPVEGDLFQRFSPQKRSKGCQPGEMAVYNPRENRCRARKPEIYFTMVVSFRTTRRAFHASASVFAVPDPEVSETRGSWFEHPAMPLGFGALCAVPGATSWCVFCPFSRCQRVPYRNVAMPIDARVRPPRAVPGDPRARVGLPPSETPKPALHRR